MDTPDNDRSTVQEHSEPSIMEILAYYHQDGFTADAFATENGMILCGECSSVLSPDHVEVHSIRRLEGESDPSDSVGVIAMVCPVCHAHATAVLKYGSDASPGETAIWMKTKDARNSDILPPNAAPGEDDPDIQPDIPAGPSNPTNEAQAEPSLH